MDTDSFSDAEIREIYKLKNIAVVGMSKSDGKAANYVPKYLMERGYNVIPVNPTAPEIMGKKSYPNVSSVPDDVDIVDVFRPSDDVLPVVIDAIKKPGIKVVWMQLGIYNEQAEKLAREKGIKVVYNRCMLSEHQRLFDE
ncbi:MAG: CoA-binding protein [Nitrososphaera sp.]|uniref:CoA-binding protein n=1 Tax=Nitrososphaera sp. TaxID=1971748 RepID=UPI003D6F0489